MPSKSKTGETVPGVSDDAIRQRAYYMWEAAGRPDGTGDHYWHLAVEEMTAVVAVTKAAPTSAAKAAAKAEKTKSPELAKPPKKKAAAEAPKAVKKAVPKPRAAPAKRSK